VDPIPVEVKRFIEINIDSVDQLEILRVLGEDPMKEWSATALVQEVQTQVETIGQHLSALQVRGLLAINTQGSELSCRYGANNPETEDMINKLLQVYRERPVTMINLVYAKARRDIQSFAEAFRLKKEK
jgi:hypothetical protein